MTDGPDRPVSWRGRLLRRPFPALAGALLLLGVVAPIGSGLASGAAEPAPTRVSASGLVQAPVGPSPAIPVTPANTHRTGLTGWTPAAAVQLRPDSSLSDVLALGPDNVWVVGHQGVWDIWENRAVIAHWDGRAWTQVSMRNDAIGADHLRSIAAVSPAELWAVGEGHDGGPYVARGAGSTWDRVSVPGLTESSWLSGVAATPGRVFAVGNRDGKTLIAGFDGQTWTIDQRELPGSLYGVALSGKDDGWAVGDTGAGPLTLHWNGRRWRVVETPKIAGGFLRDVYIEGPKSVWAVGGVYEGEGRSRPLVLRWDGRRWESVPQPARHAELYGVAGDGKGFVWVSGYDPERPADAFFLRFDGKAWKSVVSASTAERSAVRMQAVSQIHGQESAWAVGHAVDRSDRYTDVVERFTPVAPS